MVYVEVITKMLTRDAYDFSRVILFVIFYILHCISKGLCTIIEFVLSVLMEIAKFITEIILVATNQK